jgi:tetratricopeptide (TPR) repeat protein/DNA-binding XRE family transcriptional regulator
MDITAEDLRVLVEVLRVLRGWTQETMAAATDMNPSTLCRYEKGPRIPDRRLLEKLGAAASVPMWAIDGVWLPAIAMTRKLATGASASLAADDERLLTASFGQWRSVAATTAMAEFLAEPDASGSDEGEWRTMSGAEDTEDQNPWQATRAWPAADADHGADLYLEFEGLAMQLCEASARAAANDAGQALDLAHRAMTVAELTPIGAERRARLLGTTWGFLGNALRVGDELPAVEAAFASAWKLWREGAAVPNSRLAEWRLLDLEASFRRDRRQFAEALDLLDRALGAAPGEARGRILLKKASALEQAGRADTALAVLDEAAPLVDAANEPRHKFGLRFNRVVLLCHLGRHEEAHALLGEVERAARELANDLDLLRVRWLSGRVAGALGHRDEARSAFKEVASAFARRGSGYNAALVSLELAVLDLEEGRSSDVRHLAEEMLWIFSSRGVHREALAALKLFRQAVETETVTEELARRVLAYLERARQDPTLRFDDRA